jgi:hypothetical protein
MLNTVYVPPRGHSPTALHMITGATGESSLARKGACTWCIALGVALLFLGEGKRHLLLVPEDLTTRIWKQPQPT